jgi:hypothetical protein
VDGDGGADGCARVRNAQVVDATADRISFAEKTPDLAPRSLGKEARM